MPPLPPPLSPISPLPLPTPLTPTPRARSPGIGASSSHARRPFPSLFGSARSLDKSRRISCSVPLPLPYTPVLLHLVGFQSDADTVSVSAPFRRSLHPCSIRVLRPTATAGFDPSLAMERDARCARTMDKDGEQTNGSGSRRGCRSFVHGRGKTIVRIPSRSGLRGPVRSRGRGNERTNGRTRPSSQI